MQINKGKWNKYHIKEDKKVFLYPQEWVKIMDLAKSKQKLTLEIQLNTGARINEARHIKVEDVDFVRNNVILKVTKVRSKKKEKKSTTRIIPISSKFSKSLKKYIRTYKLKQNDYFPMLKPAAINSAIKKLTKKIKRKDWNDFSSHNIRKTFECWLIALNIDGFKVAKHLGHTASVAIDSYISPDIFTYDDKVLIRNILGDLYSYKERI